MMQPEISARDVLLRPWRWTDAAAVASAWEDPEILRWGRRGRGLATQALGALSGWAFSAVDEGGLGLRRIRLTHSVANAASCRVAAKAGFRQERTMRESFRYADGAWHDEHLHARTADGSADPAEPDDSRIFG
jgi:L-amino acid N-acyltransferase YncA